MKKIIINEKDILKNILLNDYDNLDKYDYSSITDLSFMFCDCFNLKTIPWFDTSNVTNMNSMFSGLHTFNDIPLLDTSNVVYMNHIFYPSTCGKRT